MEDITKKTGVILILVAILVSAAATFGILHYSKSLSNEQKSEGNMVNSPPVYKEHDSGVRLEVLPNQA